MAKLVSKKVLVPAVLAVAVALVVLAVPQAIATSDRMAEMPRINGTINAGETMKDFINDNLKVTLSQASETAAKQVENGVVVGGHLGVAQGYLVYTLYVIDPDDQTKRMVIVDAGSGEVLHASEPGQMGSFGEHGYGPWMGHGFGHWNGFGPWNGHGSGGGMWHQGMMR
ncbi:MAG: PepSY domain-containing protein [Nitrososphaera sp.]|uniref:PepSY domain-containing protein n=1 Tax=Nitrososphaera sp. TaxID=1971748 RepID=UPI003D6F2650